MRNWIWFLLISLLLFSLPPIFFRSCSLSLSLPLSLFLSSRLLHPLSFSVIWFLIMCFQILFTCSDVVFIVFIIVISLLFCHLFIILKVDTWILFNESIRVCWGFFLNGFSSCKWTFYLIILCFVLFCFCLISGTLVAFDESEQIMFHSLYFRNEYIIIIIIAKIKRMHRHRHNHISGILGVLCVSGEWIKNLPFKKRPQLNAHNTIIYLIFDTFSLFFFTLAHFAYELYFFCFLLSLPLF